MASREQGVLERRYKDLLSEICACVEQGRPPWWNRTARLGPAMLGRSGQSLRGLPTIIAWHVGEGLPRPSLSWRLRPAAQPLAEIDVNSAAVFRLPANGGDALYAAIPDKRPQELRDSPTSEHTAYWLLERLGEQLDMILTSLGAMAPDLSEDRLAVVSLAQAFIRPLGDTREPTPVALDGPWTPHRLARVAAWARLLADDVALDVLESRRPHYPPARRWYHSEQHSVSDRDYLVQLSRAGWLLHCLPAEVRQRPEAEAEYRKVSKADWRHMVPEQPLRLGLFRPAGKRSPALSALRHSLFTLQWRKRSQRLPSIMLETRWRDTAAFGVALVESLEPGLLVSEPGMAWRLIGRRARAAMQHRERIESLEDALIESDVKGFWGKLRQHHALKTWFHPTTGAPLEALVKSERWTRTDLDTLLRQQRLPCWEEGGSRYPARYLPVVRVATLRRPKKQISLDEPSILEAIALSLRCAGDWPAVTGAVATASWERHKRPKRSGGIRWLDVPCDALRAAQRAVSDVLLGVAPGAATPTAFHPGASPALHARAHAGAAAAIRMDLADFFGSVRPWHLEPWLGVGEGRDCNLLPGWSLEGRRALMALLFHRRHGGPWYLPQGAPCSPMAANLAGAWLDHAIVRRAVEVFGPGRFVYTRYADDMVLSTWDDASLGSFLDQAEVVIIDAVASQKWRVQPHKTRVWTCKDGEPLHICGIRVPRDASEPLTLGRESWRRARAALHRMRHRVDFDAEKPRPPTAAHGLLAYAYSATADLRWLAYTSRLLQTLAWRFAGPLFSESFLAGWSDMEPVVNEDGSA